METLKIQGTEDSPQVILDTGENILELSGRSLPEDVNTFYEPVLSWIEEYAKDPGDNTIVNIQLEHFNTSSSKCILDVFKMLEAIYKAKHEVLINWHYEKDDEDILEAGEDYKSLIGIPFKMIEIVK